MKRLSILVLILVTARAGLSAESRSASIDFVVLMDTSLSMADAIVDARRYAAGEIIGRLVENGDWVSILKFYGTTEVVWQGGISGEADIAAVVRSLNELKADGRFTDIGNALDSMDRMLVERGHPERPKYILLLTDERQEAPKDSRYYSADYVATHPLLEYVKRVDMGTFRVITIGYGLSARVELEARTLMTTLAEPPVRPQEPLAGAGAAGAAGAGAAAAASGTDGAMQGSAAGGSDGTGPASADSGAPDSGNQVTDATAHKPAHGAPAETGKDRRGGSFYGAPIAAAIAAAGAAGIVIALALARKRRRKDEGKRKPPVETGT